jgi:N-acetylglucosamine kinase-like BadF-type ATPase
MDYYVGIDGGGTRTSIAVGNRDGMVLYKASYDSINCYGIGYNKAKENLRIISEDLKNNGFTKLRAVYVGSSSLIDQANNELKKDLTEIFDAERTDIVSDINIILYTLEVRPSAVIISGTGSIMGMIDNDKKTVCLGGLGHLIGDEGSAYDIGSKGLRYTLRAIEGWSEDTALKEELYKYFKTKSIDEIIEKVYRETEKSVIADFSLIVESCASNGDKLSNDILTKAAEDLFEQFKALINKARVSPKEVLLSGSVLRNSKVINPMLKKLIEAYDKNIRCYESDINPEIRAMKLAIGE